MNTGKFEVEPVLNHKGNVQKLTGWIFNPYNILS